MPEREAGTCAQGLSQRLRLPPSHALRSGALLLMMWAQSAHVFACGPSEPGACVDGISSAVVAPDALRAHGQARTLEARGDVLVDARLPAAPGLSAGDADLPGGWGLWFARYHAQFEGTDPTTPYEADSRVLSLGVDRPLGDAWVVGLALNLEDTGTRTSFNAGSQDTEGWGVAPYAAWLLSDRLSADASVGMTTTRTRQERLGLDPSGVAERITGSFDNQRWFGALNLTFEGGGPSWLWALRSGYLYVHETQDAHSEQGTGLAGQLLAPQQLGARRVHLGQVYAGGEVALRIERFSPYLGAVYRHDVQRGSGIEVGGLPGGIGDPLTRDRDEVEFTYGFRWIDRSVSAWVEALHTLGRDGFRNTGLQASLHIAL
jgi:hypothetical protein